MEIRPHIMLIYFLRVFIGGLKIAQLGTGFMSKYEDLCPVSPELI